MNGGMPLARDVDLPDDRFHNDPSARTTGLPEVQHFETERDADGGLRLVRVKVRLPTGSNSNDVRGTVTFRIEGTAATPRTFEEDLQSGKSVGVRTVIRAVLAATSAIDELPGVQAVETVADVAADIADVEPKNGELRPDAAGVARNGP
jgi:hypothetical protein